MKRLFKFKYPKLLTLVIITILAYFLFKNQNISQFILDLGHLSYLGVFIAGIFFSFGFTTPLAIGFFLVANPENIILASLIGGLGGLVGDLFIFKLIKFNFLDEFYKLEETHPAKLISSVIKKSIKHKVRNYLTYAFAGLMIASPLPDEIGVSMFAGLTHIKIKALAIISFILHTLAILLILLLWR